MCLGLKPSVVLSATLIGIASTGAPAVAQIEFSKSTIRVASASAPANGSHAVQQAYRSSPVVETQQLQSDAPPDISISSQPKPAEGFPAHQAESAPPAAPRNLVHGPTIARAPSMVNVYSSQSAQTTLSKMPGPAPVRARPAAQRSQVRGKPFQAVQSEPAVSPYLNMFRKGTNADDFPTYIMTVRPELDRIEANRQQAAELKKLRGQLQNMSGPGGASSSNMPAHAHYMDTAQFYRTMHR